MATISERLAYVLTFDTKSGVKSLEQFGKAADKELGKADGKLDKLGAGMQKFGAGALAFAGIAGAGLVKLASGAADAQANMAALEQVVGEAVAQDIGKWAEDSARGVGLASKDAVSASTSFAQLGKIIGLGGEDLSKFSTDLVGLSSDFAAFKNVAPEQALQDIQAAFAGSTEVMRKYGIFLDDATLKSAYIRETGEKVTGTLTAQQKIVAINSEMYRQGADMIGQWGRESGELSGQQAILRAELTNLGDEIGAGVLPMLVSVMTTATGVVTAFSSLDSATNGLIGQFAGVGTVALAAGGALSFVAGTAIKARTNFVALKTAIIGVKLASVAWVAGIAAAVVGIALLGKKLSDLNRDALTHGAERMAELTAKYEEFVAAIEGSRSPVDTARDTFRQMALESPALTAAMREAGITIDDLAQAVANGGTEIYGLGATLESTDAAMRAAAQGVDINGLAWDDNVRLLLRAADGYLRVEGVSGDAADAVDGNTTAVDGNTDSAKTAAEALREYADAQEEAREAAKRAASSVFDLESATIDLERSIDDLRVAQLEALDPAKAGVETNRELRESQIGAAEGALEAAQAYAEEQGALKGSQREIDLQIEKLNDIKDTYPEIATEVQIMIDELSGIDTNPIGSDLALGIRDGINGSAWEIAAALRKAVLDGKISAELAARISSPSRLFAEEVGQPIAEGIAEGIVESGDKINKALAGAIKSAEGDAIKAAEDLVDAASDAFDSRWDAIDSGRQREDLVEGVADAEKALAEALKSGEADKIAAARERLEDANYRLLKATTDAIQGTKAEKDAWIETAKAAGLTKAQIDGLIKSYNALKVAGETAAAARAEISAETARATKIREDFAWAVRNGLIGKPELDAIGSYAGDPGFQLSEMARRLNIIQAAMGGPVVKYHQGGVVAGPLGSEQPAILQAGETVLTRQQSASMGMAPSIVINMPPGSDGDSVVRALRSYVRRNGPIQGLT
jgi:hypothetical protein